MTQIVDEILYFADSSTKTGKYVDEPRQFANSSTKSAQIVDETQENACSSTKTARKRGRNEEARPQSLASFVAPSDILSNLFLEDLDRIWELKKWIPDPCNPYLHYLNPDEQEEDLG